MKKSKWSVRLPGLFTVHAVRGEHVEAPTTGKTWCGKTFDHSGSDPLTLRRHVRRRTDAGDPEYLRVTCVSCRTAEATLRP